MKKWRMPEEAHRESFSRTDMELKGEFGSGTDMVARSDRHQVYIYGADGKPITGSDRELVDAGVLRALLLARKITFHLEIF